MHLLKVNQVNVLVVLFSSPKKNNNIKPNRTPIRVGYLLHFEIFMHTENVNIAQELFAELV